MIYIRKKWIIRVTIGMVSLWLAASVGMVAFSTYFIFEPTEYSEPNDFTYSQHFFKNSKGDNVEMWFAPKSGSSHTILYLHGNSGRSPSFVRKLLHFGPVAAPSYPGFGKSEGEPTTENIFETVDLSIAWLNEQGIPHEQIVVWGLSLGGSPATYAATRYPNLHRVVIVNAFDSVQGMGYRRYGPVAVFAGGILNSLRLAPYVQAPIRQFHALNDTVVPYEAGINLHKNMPEGNKVFTTLNEGTHTEFDIAATFQEPNGKEVQFFVNP